MTANSKVINLIEIGNQLALSAKGLHKKIEENNGQSLNVPASMIASKIPDLKVLGDNPIFRLRKTEDCYKADAAGVWVDDNGEANLYYSDFEIMEGFTPIRYKSGINGWVEVKHKSGLELKISISTNDDHILELSSQELDGVEGEGMPNPAYLRLIPQPETPLYSDELPHNIEFTIISNGKFSRKFNTPLVTIKSESGKVFKDVICNAALQRIYKEYGQGAKFKIVNKHPKRNRQGEPVTANGEVSQNNHAWIVNILDCQSVDFSDL